MNGLLGESMAFFFQVFESPKPFPYIPPDPFLTSPILLDPISYWIVPVGPPRTPSLHPPGFWKGLPERVPRKVPFRIELRFTQPQLINLSIDIHWLRRRNLRALQMDVWKC